MLNVSILADVVIWLSAKATVNLYFSKTIYLLLRNFDCFLLLEKIQGSSGSTNVLPSVNASFQGNYNISNNNRISEKLA